MGVTLQWRQPSDRDPRAFGREIEFGSLSSRRRGYMAYTERSGPGVVVLSDRSDATQFAREFADALRDEGFTALVPELRPDLDAASVTRAACKHLVENWHPRLGILAFGTGCIVALELAREIVLDALVLYDGPDPETDVHFLAHPAGVAGDQDAFEETVDFLLYHAS